jgi:hypothetical protein
VFSRPVLIGRGLGLTTIFVLAMEFSKGFERRDGAPPLTGFRWP